jgi:hypothetical protein
VTPLLTLVARVRAARAALLADLQATAGKGLLYRRETPTGAVTVTRSTRPGVEWQVTAWDRDGAPTGHVDAGSLEAACTVVAGMGAK